MDLTQFRLDPAEASPVVVLVCTLESCPASGTGRLLRPGNSPDPLIGPTLSEVLTAATAHCVTYHRSAQVQLAGGERRVRTPLLGEPGDG